MKGVLLVNLGSPDTPSPKDIRKYLDEFLMDKRVIDSNIILRNIIVRGIILNTRPKKSAEAYQKIWWKEGSPLIVLSERFHKKVSGKTDIPVALGMRYGSMTIKEGYEKLIKQGVTEVLLVPLYPHYAMSSFETVEEKAKQVQKKYFPQMTTEVLPAFYNKPDYIKVMANNIRKNIENFDHDHILFSYHGIPESHVLKSDCTKSHCKLDNSCCDTFSKCHATCYRHQCLETTKEIVKELDLKEGSYSNSFQSRLGKEPWLKPYTDFEFNRLPQEENKKKLAVITPAFVSDCLETLEEIAMEGDKQFKKGGGKTYKHIPCLNDNDDWVDVMVDWIDLWAKKTKK
ncbi:ferrochelatase [Flavicella sp.]|uniref:ferrochelatase n=1 Tax=Flavicella sp. TaxID=2957742 RepID=UPI003016487C